MPIATSSPPQILPKKRNLEAGRLDSFDKWPHPDSGNLSKINMAKAGFFYTGIQDHVKCFVCHVKLVGWNPEEDDPWQKHLEVSPNCLFAKKGKEEADLTVEEWLDIFREQALNKVDQKFKLL